MSYHFPDGIGTLVGRVTPCAPQSLCGRAAGRGLPALPRFVPAVIEKCISCPSPAVHRLPSIFSAPWPVRHGLSTFRLLSLSFSFAFHPPQSSTRNPHFLTLITRHGSLPFPPDPVRLALHPSSFYLHHLIYSRANAAARRPDPRPQPSPGDGLEPRPGQSGHRAYR